MSVRMVRSPYCKAAKSLGVFPALGLFFYSRLIIHHTAVTVIYLLTELPAFSTRMQWFSRS